ncbi:MAG: hypothetical protein K2X93_11710 [Candidatus Obscuribacterales bacterium]|nr:hypothetical protein [Candidatus Obscuribacterales bacterium]
MFRAYIFMMALCMLLGFLFSSPTNSATTALDANLFCLASMAAWIGGMYAIVGIAVGWYFIKRLDTSITVASAFLMAIPVHIASTLIVTYLFPGLVYWITRSSEAWLFVGSVSFLFGLPQTLVDFFLFRWLFKLPLKKPAINTILLWKTTTMLSCIGLLVLLWSLMAVGCGFSQMFSNHYGF